MEKYKVRGNGKFERVNFLIFSFERNFKTIYNTLLPFFPYLAYFYKYFDRKE